MSEKQVTLKKEISISGIGLHTGVNVTLNFKPAKPNTGFMFRRIDLEGQPEFPALVDYVVDTSRGTTLEYKGARVTTIEHVLAALVGLDIDNVIIEMDHDEAPILDGSSIQYVNALREAGFEEQDEDRVYFDLDEVISFTDDERSTEMTIIPDEKRRYSVMIDYNTDVLGTQNAELNCIHDFEKEIAPCRTFVFLHELEFLLDNNLIKGGDLSNAIVFVNKKVSDKELERLATLFNKPSVKVAQRGILNNLELSYDNEAARHKLLDVIGDLALIGHRVRGRIIAVRPGHPTNVAFAKKIRAYIKKKTSGAPKYDPNKKPLYDISDIKKLLPHRPPFLLVDKVLDMSETRVVGLKSVTMNEPFFVGHFPDEPVMPAVLQIEAMAQCGGILIMSGLKDPENYVTYFLKIDNVRLRQKVVPGDTIIFQLDLLSPIRRGLCHMGGRAWVGDKLVMEADMLAQIVKKK
ncbi:MAG: bifunctional UDP-3-O-[3-hydroxymyristoyl] N-acetylglucosamine deacetylase/3-hydroxyacyl-ACP dehydratase [Bacteroidales bacterium]|nr:bifunctional UDP-3-O-[3-hydroxymyristoyl] N-acetylglucosamine deacetylase/3-hydroxyacyl-ACP dehydratase [Bacteroidales bacterium]